MIVQSYTISTRLKRYIKISVRTNQSVSPAYKKDKYHEIIHQINQVQLILNDGLWME